jgi:hypothetical protein
MINRPPTRIDLRLEDDLIDYEETISMRKNLAKNFDFIKNSVEKDYSDFKSQGNSSSAKIDNITKQHIINRFSEDAFGFGLSHNQIDEEIEVEVDSNYKNNHSEEKNNNIGIAGNNNNNQNTNRGVYFSNLNLIEGGNAGGNDKIRFNTIIQNNTGGNHIIFTPTSTNEDVSMK